MTDACSLALLLEHKRCSAVVLIIRKIQQKLHVSKNRMPRCKNSVTLQLFSLFPERRFGSCESTSCKRELSANGKTLPYGMLGNRAGSCTEASTPSVRRKYVDFRCETPVESCFIHGFVTLCNVPVNVCVSVQHCSVSLGQSFLWCGCQQDPERFLHVWGFPGEGLWRSMFCCDCIYRFSASLFASTSPGKTKA